MIDKRVSSIGLSAKELPYQHKPKHPKYISEKHYKNIMNLFFKKVMYYMIKDGVKFVIPQSLGTLQILRYAADEHRKKHLTGEVTKGRVMVDFHATKLLKARGIDKTVKHSCKSTGGYWWTARWFKTFYARFKTQRLYSFKFTRPNIRPNSYNPENPELSIVPYFRDKGWEIYAELPRVFKKPKHD